MCRYRKQKQKLHNLKWSFAGDFAHVAVMESTTLPTPLQAQPGQVEPYLLVTPVARSCMLYIDLTLINLSLL
jgi:hypothetical protein